ncbi:plasmid mobilization protein [Mesorhizobium muleiense]
MIENIRLRVTPEEKSALRAAAMRRGLTLSEYIREAASQASQRAAA